MKEASSASRLTEANAKGARPWRRSVFWLVLAVFVVLTVGRQLCSTDGKTKRQLTALLQSQADTAIKARRAVFKVDQMAEPRDQSNLKAALKDVSSAKTSMDEAKTVFDSFVTFIDGNREQLLSEGLGSYVALSGLYGETYSSLQKAIDTYLASYQALLEYAIENDARLHSREQAALNRYGELNSALQKAFSARWLAYEEHHQFLLTYAEVHPEVAVFINQAKDMLLDVDIE